MIWVFLIVSVALSLIQLSLMLPFWKKDAECPQNPEPISVLIAAHNEETNLLHLLPSVLDQDFASEFEVIVILDRCTDDSRMVVKAFIENHSNLKMLEIEQKLDGWSPKKWAISKGIEAAKYDCLAFTDADCKIPQTWLKSVSASFSEGNELVLGLSPYFKTKGLLNLLIRFETLMTAILYMGLANFGFPYMAVGRNFAYRKRFFENAGGFGKDAARLSGDDDLLVNRAARYGKTGRIVGLETQVLSEPKHSWKAWISQKIRHGSAGRAYKFSSLLILSSMHLMHLLFYVSLVGVLCLQDAWIAALAIYLVRTCLMVALIWQIPWKDKRNMAFAFPLLDFLYLAYLSLLVPAIAFIQPKWKDRNGGSV